MQKYNYFLKLANVYHLKRGKSMDGYGHGVEHIPAEHATIYGRGVKHIPTELNRLNLLNKKKNRIFAFLIQNE